MGLDPDAPERGPTLADVIARALAAARAGLHTSIPAAVTRYDAAKQQVDCKPLVKQAFLDEEDARQVASLPVVANVPVQFPGAGRFRVTFPISDGGLVVDGNKIPATLGTLFFFERSVDKWLSGSGSEVDPEIDHDHALADAVFVPGLNPFGAPLGDVPTDHVTIGVDGGLQIHLRGDVITIGDESGSQPIPLGDDLEQRIEKLEAAFKNHDHAVPGKGTTCVNGSPWTGSATTAPPSNAAAVDGNPTFAASQGKVQ